MEIRMAPMLAIHNKDRLKMVTECACYHCLRIFNVSEIKEWTDRDNDTALCPHCSVDAVLAINEESEKDPIFLSKVNKYWF